MKKLIILSLLAVFVDSTQAQTFSEWFRQKKTQKKYLIQQIAVLQVYLGYVNKGYSIAHKGLKTIRDLKHGELNLHTDYFNSLQNVNPKIRNYAKVADIIFLQQDIIQAYYHAYTKTKESGAFNQDEINYIGRVFKRLLDDCAGTIDELITLTTNGKLEMKDDERLKSIDKLYTDMEDKYSFVKDFGNEAILLAAARMQVKNDTQISRALYGIKNK
ncbi:hypothetical protein [Rubrolithibacter danxiaensis]|uniref:hypothetical protein n=1 Tax=Rubrolithibacter danxiaensis TaxID=3390805 RepID=UPI003BF7D7A4